LTALNRTFTRAVFFVPALTDTMGYLKERRSGWPKIVESHPKELKAAAAKNAPYFDAANFASRIRIPVRVAVGFADEACPPCAVYAAYNEIKVSDKGIENGFGMPHSCYQEIYTKLRQWLFAQEMKGNRR
jgi:cephalosporin-C deacetylase-like acetyl esterase